MKFETFAKRLGQRLALIRQEKEMTQAQLARDAGLSLKYVSMIEAGTNPSIRTTMKMCDALSQSSLSSWLREAGKVVVMTKNDKSTRGKEQAPRRPKDWSVEEKMRVLTEAASLPPEKLGDLLRREGLHEADLEQWSQSVREVLSAQSVKRSRSNNAKDKKRIKALERELRRKDKALAEAAALLILKKKAQAIWGDEEDDTDRRRGR